MVVTHTGAVPKTRSVYRLSGVAPPVEYGVHNNNLSNLVRGLQERVFFVEEQGQLVPPPRPAPGVFAARMKEFKDRLLGKMEMAAPCSLDEFVKMYAGDRRQKVYAQAVESLRFRPVEMKDACLTTFVKAEKINFTAKSDPAPRVIQPRTPRYNAMVGCYLKRLEKAIYRGIAEVYGDTTVLKGQNAEGTAALLRSKWESFQDPVAVGLDASRFDQHVSKDALKWEHSVYEKCFYPQYRGELRQLLKWQLLNKGFARATDGFVKYQVEGCRMSGDMNTALGNCLIMCGLVHAYCEQVGVRVKLANNGDDCVVFMERRDLVRFSGGLKAWFREMGFTMKVEEPVRVFERIEFCQTNPVCVDGTWRMCRNFYTAMAKDSTSVLPLERGGGKWAHSIGVCGMALAGGVPVFQEFYNALIRAGSGAGFGKHPALEGGFAIMSNGMHAEYTAISDSTRVSFWEAYGILPTEQLILEERLRAWIGNPNEVLRGVIYDPQFTAVPIPQVQ